MTDWKESRVTSASDIVLPFLDNAHEARRFPVQVRNSQIGIKKLRFVNDLGSQLLDYARIGADFPVLDVDDPTHVLDSLSIRLVKLNLAMVTRQDQLRPATPVAVGYETRINVVAPHRNYPEMQTPLGSLAISGSDRHASIDSISLARPISAQVVSNAPDFMYDPEGWAFVSMVNQYVEQL